MDKKTISKWLHSYFYNLDDPPASQLSVPENEISQDEESGLMTANIIYDGEYIKGHQVTIEFDPLKLSDKDFEYQYI